MDYEYKPKAWPSIPQSLRVLARGVRKVIAGITGLLQPSVHK
jgi:hypothetical protein